MKRTKEQLKKELKACGIKLSDRKSYVRWNHHKYGIVFDTIEDYRRYNGHADNIDDLEFVIPYNDAR